MKLFSSLVLCTMSIFLTYQVSMAQNFVMDDPYSIHHNLLDREYDDIFLWTASVHTNSGTTNYQWDISDTLHLVENHVVVSDADAKLAWFVQKIIKTHFGICSPVKVTFDYIDDGGDVFGSAICSPGWTTQDVTSIGIHFWAFAPNNPFYWGTSLTPETACSERYYDYVSACPVPPNPCPIPPCGN